MVAEALVLREATKDLISKNSPVAMNGKHELDFISDLFTHIDSGRSFGGLKMVSDGNAIMWTVDEGINELREDCMEQSDPDNLYTNYQKEKDEKYILEEKDVKIAQLEKKINTLSRQVGDLDNPEIQV